MKKLWSVVMVLVLASLASAQGTDVIDSPKVAHCYGYPQLFKPDQWVSRQDSICVTDPPSFMVKVDRPIPAGSYVYEGIQVKQAKPATDTNWTPVWDSFSDSLYVLSELYGMTSRYPNGLVYFGSTVAVIGIDVPIRPKGKFPGFVVAPCSLLVAWGINTAGGTRISGTAKFPVTIVQKWPTVSVVEIPKLVPYVPKRQEWFCNALGRKVPGFVSSGVYVSKEAQLIEWRKLQGKSPIVSP